MNFDLFSLKGKKALITGASAGLGRHFAKVLAAAGAEVIVVARRLEKLQTLANEITANQGAACSFITGTTIRVDGGLGINKI